MCPKRVPVLAIALFLDLLAFGGLFGQNASPVPVEAVGFSGGGLHLFPLGWSSEGRWGALVGREAKANKPGNVRIIIIDAVTDEVLYESEDFSWSGPNFIDEFWSRKAAVVIETVDAFDLESLRKPDVRDPEFTTGGVKYAFEMDPSSPASGSYRLRITSSRGDGKSVYSSSTSAPPDQSQLLGAMVSPFEERALAIIREQYPGVDGEVRYRFSGAHLTLGFHSTRPENVQAPPIPRGNLLTAVFNGQDYLVKSRLAAGADPDIRDNRGYPVILVAARLGHWTMVRDLLDAGAEPNPRDSAGRSALHHAAFAGDVESVRALIAAGADKSRRDGAGRTPAELAADATIRSLLR